MKKKLLFAITCVALISSSFAAQFVEGKDYQVIHPKNLPETNGIEVVEFFSLSCPWCFQFEPAVEHWQSNLPKDVSFKRVHVTFESNGVNLAKAYYTARALKLTPKINLTLFQLVQKEHSKLDEKTLGDLFEKHGVDRKNFESSFRFSTGLNTLIIRGESLMENYDIMAVPSMVVAGKYKTDSGMAQGDAARFVNIVKFLVSKARKEASKIS